MRTVRTRRQSSITSECKPSYYAGTKLKSRNIAHCTTCTQAAALISLGLRQRATARTTRNDISSRSHTILTIALEQQRKDTVSRSGDEATIAGCTIDQRLSKLLLVDLAGSERAGRPRGCEGGKLYWYKPCIRGMRICLRFSNDVVYNCERIVCLCEWCGQVVVSLPYVHWPTGIPTVVVALFCVTRKLKALGISHR